MQTKFMHAPTRTLIQHTQYRETIHARICVQCVHAYRASSRLTRVDEAAFTNTCLWPIFFLSSAFTHTHSRAHHRIVCKTYINQHQHNCAQPSSFVARIHSTYIHFDCSTYVNVNTRAYYCRARLGSGVNPIHTALNLSWYSFNWISKKKPETVSHTRISKVWKSSNSTSQYTCMVYTLTRIQGERDGMRNNEANRVCVCVYL